MDKCLCCGSEDLREGDLKIEYENKSGNYSEEYGYDSHEADVFFKQGRGFYADKCDVTAKKCEDCGFIMLWG